jgi:hypothetical protein
MIHVNIRTNLAENQKLVGAREHLQKFCFCFKNGLFIRRINKNIVGSLMGFKNCTNIHQECLLGTCRKSLINNVNQRYFLMAT